MSTEWIRDTDGLVWCARLEAFVPHIDIGDRHHLFPFIFHPYDSRDVKRSACYGGDLWDLVLPHMRSQHPNIWSVNIPEEHKLGSVLLSLEDSIKNKNENFRRTTFDGDVAKGMKYLRTYPHWFYKNHHELYISWLKLVLNEERGVLKSDLDFGTAVFGTYVEELLREPLLRQILREQYENDLMTGMVYNDTFGVYVPEDSVTVSDALLVDLEEHGIDENALKDHIPIGRFETVGELFESAVHGGGGWIRLRKDHPDVMKKLATYESDESSFTVSPSFDMLMPNKVCERIRHRSLGFMKNMQLQCSSGLLELLDRFETEEDIVKSMQMSPSSWSTSLAKQIESIPGGRCYTDKQCGEGNACTTDDGTMLGACFDDVDGIFLSELLHGNLGDLQLEAVLENALNNNVIALKNVPGDGSCMYHSIAAVLEMKDATKQLKQLVCMSYEHYKEVRRKWDEKVASALRMLYDLKHRGDDIDEQTYGDYNVDHRGFAALWEKTSPGELTASKENFETYYGASWGDEIALTAICKSLRVIGCLWQIHTSGDPKIHFSHEKVTRLAPERTMVIRLEENHYQAVIGANGGSFALACIVNQLIQNKSIMDKAVQETIEFTQTRFKAIMKEEETLLDASSIGDGRVVDSSLYNKLTSMDKNELAKITCRLITELRKVNTLIDDSKLGL